MLADLEAGARLEIGSGRRGRSYLVERDGFPYQSPISWYAQAARWDLSPGFTESTHFNRPVLPECLFCHANRADAVEGTCNRYRQPVLRDPAIGCERCHGPGALHVAARERGEAVSGLDDTIVNPARLEPELRESVCQQCHLQGDVRVLPRGRRPFDFRPGLPLRLFCSVFVRPPDLTDNQKSVPPPPGRRSGAGRGGVRPGAGRPAGGGAGRLRGHAGAGAGAGDRPGGRHPPRGPTRPARRRRGARPPHRGRQPV